MSPDPRTSLVARADVHRHALRARRLGVHTHDQAIVFMRSDCHVCRSEGLTPHSRVLLSAGGRETIATLYQVTDHLVAPDEAGLSDVAWERLGIAEGEPLLVRHPDPVLSLSSVRGRIYGNRLDGPALRAIMSDVVKGWYSDVHLSSFITACAAVPLGRDETVALTRAMVEVGDRLTWSNGPILDKHSVGGLPGNRTTPIVVAIVAAHGLTIPKTSSRAITSPAGTADTMETLAPVDLDLPAIRRVVERESGCVVWGGAVRLSPADDILIRVERALDIDSEGQLIASVLSKKIAAGSTRLVIDMPVGPTAKVRSPEAAQALSSALSDVAQVFGLETTVVIADGAQPVGRGIGPALEARDVLAVLQQTAHAPQDLQAHACKLAGALLELGGKVGKGGGASLAAQTLRDGRAWQKFQRICEAQGGMRTPPHARQRRPLPAPASRPRRIHRQPEDRASGKAGRRARGEGRRRRDACACGRSPRSRAARVHAARRDARRAPLRPRLRRIHRSHHLDRATMSSALVIALPGSEDLAGRIARGIGAELGQLETRTFPDGETYLRLRSDPSGREIVLVCTLDRPDAKFLPLIFAAITARQLGATRVALVAPYLAYMRQDKRFHDGEAITSSIFATLVSSAVDALVTVDPHLHRYETLNEIYSIPAAVARSAPLIAEWIAENERAPLIIGPDVESEQWVSEVAARAKAPYRVLRKERRGDRDVEITIPDLHEFRDRMPVLVDDIVSSGRTMLETARHLKAQGFPGPTCIAVHALLSSEAYDALCKLAGAVISTNTVPHPSNRIDMSGPLATATAALLMPALETGART
jgi:thymidine phosphorylase